MSCLCCTFDVWLLNMIIYFSFNLLFVLKLDLWKVFTHCTVIYIVKLLCECLVVALSLHILDRKC